VDCDDCEHVFGGTVVLSCIRMLANSYSMVAGSMESMVEKSTVVCWFCSSFSCVVVSLGLCCESELLLPDSA
jgi:hypothetical protein